MDTELIDSFTEFLKKRKEFYFISPPRFSRGCIRKTNCNFEINNKLFVSCLWICVLKEFFFIKLHFFSLCLPIHPKKEYLKKKWEFSFFSSVLPIFTKELSEKHTPERKLIWITIFQPVLRHFLKTKILLFSFLPHAI